MNATGLIVPIELHALVYNQGVYRSQPFTRWFPTYRQMLEQQGPAEPPPETGQQNDIDGQFGIHLQWQLPEALTTGHYDPKGHDTTFPLIPNRWLIVRYHTAPGSTAAHDPKAARQAVGWVVSSDFLFAEHPSWEPPPDARFAPYVNGVSPGAPFFDSLGRADRLAASTPWQDPGGTPHLTAVGPGLPAFAAFEPYHHNVLSFYDDLADLRPSSSESAPPDTFSYLAVGWYHSRAVDVLVKAADIPGLLPPEATGVEDVIRALHWSLPKDTGADPLMRSYYAGSALAVHWNQDGDAPRSAMPKHDTVRVAVGHSTDDAVGALTTRRTGSGRTADLVRALYHGTIDTFDHADGHHHLDEATRATWFSGRNAGHAWEITDQPTDDATPPIRHQRADDPAWLGQLNERQATYDALLTRLTHARRRYWTLHWLRGLPGKQRPDDFDAAADQQLATARASIDELISQADELRQELPHGTTPDELQEAIRAFLTKHPLPPGRELKRVAAPTFHQPADPVVAIEGSGATQPLTRDPDHPLPCRVTERLLTSVHYNGTWHDAPAAPPSPNLAGDIPHVCTRLIPEFALLDLAARTLSETTPGGTGLDDILADPDQHTRGLLAEHTAPWRQPWLPMYLQWDLRYSPTPFRTGSRDNWWFDGTDYTWLGTGSLVADEEEARLRSHQGRAFLTPTTAHVLRGQLRRYRATFPTAHSEELAALDTDLQKIDILSQSLDGLTEWLLRQDGAARRVPGAAASRYTGDGGTVPRPGKPKPPTDPADFFQPVRAGQFFFTDLRLIDRFGRVVDIVAGSGSAPEQFTPCRAVSVTPSRELFPKVQGVQRFLQLPPRVLHEARVRFEPVDARLGTRYATGPATADIRAAAAGSGPVGAWLLLNRIDHTLLVYAPDGAPLGELRVVRGVSAEPHTAWNPLPRSPYYAHPPGSEIFQAAFPQLNGLATELLAQPSRSFTDLLTAIDTALRHIEVTHAQGDRMIARLIGRPLALVRADLTIDLQGPLLTNPSWPTVLDPPREEYPSYQWPVRLGEVDRLSDGLVGYYATRGAPGDAISYDRIYAVRPVSGSAYTVPIGRGESLALSARMTTEPPVTHALSLFVDPYAGVHAHTGILPVEVLRLPAELVDHSLERISASFRLAPILAPLRTEIDAAPASPDGAAARDEARHGVVMPHPAPWYGTWSWTEPDLEPGATEPTWSTTPIIPADTRCHPDDPVPTARAGYLQLSPVRPTPEAT